MGQENIAGGRPPGSGEEGVDPLFLIELDQDHPGFRDPDYRARRGHIAQLARDFLETNHIQDAPYTEAEHALWRHICARIEAAHQRYACDAFKQGWRALDLDTERIPQLRDVSRRIKALSGFELIPVAGMINPRAFLARLAEGAMWCTQYIRHTSVPEYTPEPDIVHEYLGHAAMLAYPDFARMARCFGVAAAGADDDAIRRLGNLYWWTIEFGAVTEQGATKAYGAGLLSSFGEMERLDEVELRPFDVEAMCETSFDPTTYQPFLFCAQDMEQVIRELRAHLNCHELWGGDAIDLSTPGFGNAPL